MGGGNKSSVGKKKEALKKRREMVKRRLQGISEDCPQNRIEALDKEFTALQEQIIEFNCSLSDTEQELDVEEAQAEFDLLLNEALKPKNKATGILSTKTLLPQLDLPCFSGDLLEWAHFWGLFKTLVHGNPNLTNLEKFSYLASRLSGEALGTIRHLTITDENYVAAFQTLEARYVDKRKLAAHYVDQICGFCPKENPEAQGFLQLHLGAATALKTLIPQLDIPGFSGDLQEVAHFLEAVQEKLSQLTIEDEPSSSKA